MPDLPAPTAPAKAVGAAVIVFAAIAAAAVIALISLGPPGTISAAAPPDRFSAERAMVHVRALAPEPHPAGSEANTRVRAYLVSQLTALGLAPEVVTTQIVEGRKAAEVHNVLARIPGRANTKAFAVTAHYDSVRYGPGAADDIGGVAAILEAARAIQAGPSLSNDVLLIFTDAEEAGLLGAKAFLRHPWAKEIGVLLGLEARGNCGPSLIFETSPGNGWLIAQLAAAGVTPRASSLSSSIYERLPFTGDFTHLKQHGIPGFHAAFIGGFAQYHTRDDSPANLSPASLQHHGEYALGLARHFGNLPLARVTAPDAVYFNALGSWLVHYPLTWSGPLTIFTFGLCIATLAFGFLRRHLTFRGMLGGALACAGIAVSACSIVALLLPVVFGPTQLVALYRNHLTQLSYLRPLHHNELYGFTFALAAAATIVALFAWVRNRVRILNLAAGALLWWLALLGALQWLLPGGSYLAAWPLLFAALQLFILFLQPPSPVLAANLVVWLTPLALPAVFLLVPAYRHFLTAVMIILAPVMVLIPSLLAGLMLPQLELVSRHFRGWLPGLAGGAAVLLLAFGLTQSSISPTRPGLDCVAYALDKDSNQAFWLSSDETSDKWTAQFFPDGTPRAAITDFFPHHYLPCLRAPAPLSSMGGPELRTISDITTDGRRQLTLTISSPDRPTAFEVHLLSDTEVFSAAVFGQPVDGAHRGWQLDFKTFPPAGATLTLEVAAGATVKLKLISQHYQLPEFAGYRPRPAQFICEPNTVNRSRSIRSDQTLVARTFDLPPPAARVAAR